LKVKLLAPNWFYYSKYQQKSDDYSHIKDNYRQAMQTMSMTKKYGFRDYRGGGRSSARETASRVAGAIAKQMLPKIKIHAYVSSVGHINLNKSYHELDFNL
jgi:chorismate synthase